MTCKIADKYTKPKVHKKVHLAVNVTSLFKCYVHCTVYHVIFFFFFFGGGYSLLALDKLKTA